MFGRTKITLWESNWIQAILCQVFGSQNDKPVHPNQPRWALAACGSTGRKPTDAASENVYAQIVIESSWALCLDSGTTIYDTSMNPLEQNTGTPCRYSTYRNILKKMRLPSEVLVFPACFPSDDYTVIFLFYFFLKRSPGGWVWNYPRAVF